MTTEPTYEIMISGVAGPAVRPMLAGLGEVTVEGEKTLLRCADTDQAALHGVLGRLQDLGVDILAVRRIETTDAG